MFALKTFFLQEVRNGPYKFKGTENGGGNATTNHSNF